jgi:predicted RNA binding protein YcfA (HicA-like mRNA interferase family)
MTKFPRVTGDKLIKALRRAGFLEIRQRGSHVMLSHPDGRMTTVPIHKGEEIGIGLLKKILRDADIAPGEFQTLLKG